MGAQRNIKPYPLNKKLTPRQARWVKHYCDCLDKTEASRRCHYSPKSCSQVGWENSILLEKFVERELERRDDAGETYIYEYSKAERLQMARKELESKDPLIRVQAIRIINQINKQDRDWQLKKAEIEARKLEAEAQTKSEVQQETVFRIEVIDNENS